jgi:hypothetical protein
MTILRDIQQWFEGLPHWFRRLPVVFNWIWFQVYHWFIDHKDWWNEAIRQFVRFGWDFMLIITACTFILVLSRLVPRRTR